MLLLGEPSANTPYPLARTFAPSPPHQPFRSHRIIIRYRIDSPKPDSTREKDTFSLDTPSPRRVTSDCNLHIVSRRCLKLHHEDQSAITSLTDREGEVRRNFRVGKHRPRKGVDFDTEHHTGIQQCHTNRNNWFHSHGCLTAYSDSHAGV